jgi:hypothetical protein
MIYMKTKIILTTICSFLFLFGCGNDDVIIDDDKEVIIEKKNLVFDANEKTSSVYNAKFKCENTDSWYVSSITEIVVGDTIKKEMDEIEGWGANDWYGISKRKRYLSISFNSNITGLERKLIINISSDSLFNDEILTVINPALPDLSIEDENEKKKLTGHIWQRWIYNNNNVGFFAGEPFEFLENGIIRVYYSYPDKENNYRDESEYKITGDYFFREDFFVNEFSGILNDYYNLKRRLYTYKFFDDMFEIKVKYGAIQNFNTYTYVIVD